MGRLRRLCGKITEVMREDYGGYAGRLRRLCGKITEVMREDYGGYAVRLWRLYGKITDYGLRILLNICNLL